MGRVPAATERVMGVWQVERDEVGVKPRTLKYWSLHIERYEMQCSCVTCITHLRMLHSNQQRQRDNREMKPGDDGEAHMDLQLSAMSTVMLRNPLFVRLPSIRLDLGIGTGQKIMPGHIFWDEYTHGNSNFPTL